ncbi:two-component response regulator ARR2-like [Telopea speciosissima]|uniref:two-component response regulator ARR2-like n=1 Tax=Telopea speciosissima TaxID=54955 RepID=UPI001CC48BDB|nr:two-component response regulator ARR2-like [Telopea speciosissima]
MDDQRALIAQSSSTKPSSTGIRVLAVDVDATCLHIVEVMLQALQYEVVPVKYASDALAILRERQGGFDIVLMNLHMLEMDGIVLLEHVEVEFKIPVVTMSTNDKEVVASRCLESGASFYLTKPLIKSDLSNLWQYVYLKKHNEKNGS